MIVMMPIRFAMYSITNNVRALLVARGIESDLLEYSDAWTWPWPGAAPAAGYLALITLVALGLAMAAAARRSLARGEAG
jgi:hypothetical protein